MLILSKKILVFAWILSGLKNSLLDGIYGIYWISSLQKLLLSFGRNLLIMLILSKEILVFWLDTFRTKT